MAKRFGTVAAVSNITFQVQPATVYGLIGPNGAGKTTTMRLILGITEMDQGTIRHERAIDQVPRHRLAYVPEERGLYPRMNVEEQLLLFGALGGRTPAASRRACEHWIERLQIEPYRRRLGSDLSKGNARKVQLALALMNEPELVVLDEPFEGLDPVNVRLAKDVLREAVAGGTTFLLSSHTMDFVQDLCDGVVLVDRGHTVVSGTLEDVRARSDRRVLRLTIKGAGDAEYARYEQSAGLGRGTRYGPVGVRTYELKAADVVAKTTDLLLDAARAHGTVSHFSFGPPGLEDVYIELVRPAAPVA